jgi:hypothetical protein
MRLATTSSTRSWAPPHPTAESKPRDAFVPFNQRASARVAPPVGSRARITCFREVVVDRSLLSGKSYLIGNLQQRRTGRSYLPDICPDRRGTTIQRGAGPHTISPLRVGPGGTRPQVWLSTPIEEGNGPALPRVLTTQGVELRLRGLRSMHSITRRSGGIGRRASLRG